MTTIENHREIDISSLYYDLPEPLGDGSDFSTQKRSDGFHLLRTIVKELDMVVSAIFAHPRVQSLIREVNGTSYDLIIHELLSATALLGFADLVGNPPIIGVATTHMSAYAAAAFGNPTMPSSTPPLLFAIGDRMTAWQRAFTLFYDMYTAYVVRYRIRPLLEKYMHDNFRNRHRKLVELENNQSLLIVCAAPATGYPKPVQPNTVHVGPLHLRTRPHRLPEDLQKWMDDSEDGVIYFSLGSNMQGTSLPENTIAAFIRAFERFPKMRVLWKWEADSDLPGRPENVLVKRWFPQQSILAHQKTRLFISQVGLQSYEEATYYGVPILGVPIFGDQDFNAKKLATSGAGLSIEFQTITYEILHEKLRDLLTNKSYKESMLRQSLIIRDTPMLPQDTAVWWVEYVLRHNGAPHLRPASLDLTWYQYFMLDILLPIFFLVSTTLYAISLLIKKLFSFFILK